MHERFEDMLTGGHPNSLGRTPEVAAAVLARPARLAELFGCYAAADPVVRLRTSNALKRVEAARPDLLVPCIDRLIDEVGALDQASAQWTLAPARALGLLQRNLAAHDDWIVLNATMETLSRWAADDPGLRRWLLPHLERLSTDRRKSVAARARRHRRRLDP